jgi:hypothetical protein
MGLERGAAARSRQRRGLRGFPEPRAEGVSSVSPRGPSPPDTAAARRLHYEALEETMSTIPLTLVEGAIAMPRLRPLRLVPTSFGRDWALRPPARNWRAELKALYAAVLHTFCLTDQAILSFCQWVPLEARRAAAGAATAAQAFERAAGPAMEAAPRETKAHRVADGVVRSTTIEAPVYRAPGERAIRWSALAGGACAMGGVAMLAWVALSYSEHRQPASSLKTDDVAKVSRDMKPTRQPVVETTAAKETHAGDTGATVRGSTEAHVDARPVGVPAPAADSASTAASNKEIITRRGTSHASDEQPATPRTSARRHPAQNLAANNVPRVIARHHDKSRTVTPVIARHRSPAPSVAGDYSPLLPAELASADEYASVTTYAATHLRDLAPGPRAAAASSNLSDAGATEWTGRMTHRRVTDAPEQFSK